MYVVSVAFLMDKASWLLQCLHGTNIWRFQVTLGLNNGGLTDCCTQQVSPEFWILLQINIRCIKGETNGKFPE